MNNIKNLTRNSENTSHALAESDCHEMSDNKNATEGNYQELPAYTKDEFANDSDYQEMSSYKMYECHRYCVLHV